MKFVLALLSMLVIGTGSLFAANNTPCPAVGSDTNGCEFVINVTAVNGSGLATAFTVSTNTPDQGPYDGSDDTLVGIVNNSGATLKSITLPNTAGQFSFENDGACTGTFSPGPTAAQCLGGVFTSNDPNDYLSVSATSFSNITGTTGQVNFGPGGAGIGPGATAWFSLEGALTASQIGTPGPPISATPIPNSILLMLVGLCAMAAFYFTSGKFARVS